MQRLVLPIKLIQQKATMEALWNLEDQLKISTPKAVVLFLCTSFLAIGFCIATVLKRRARRKGVLVDQEPCMDDEDWAEPRPGWGSVKKMLMSSVVWSGASKWEERHVRGNGRVRPTPLLVKGKGGCDADVGWQSHNSESPVWQRPILMGDKCELPRFSGLILYDENGRPLHYSNRDTNAHEDETAFERTTLRDLLIC